MHNKFFYTIKSGMSTIQIWVPTKLSLNNSEKLCEYGFKDEFLKYFFCSLMLKSPLKMWKEF